MAFDLSTARPVDEPRPSSAGGFDLATARPIDDSNVTSNNQKQITTTPLGAFSASAGEGVGIARGALAGARAAMAITPPVLPFVGPLAKPIAGIVGGIGGGMLTSMGITSLEQFADTVFGTNIVATREAQQKQNPIATKAGSISGMVLNPWLRPMLPKTVGEGVAMGTVGVGVGAGMRAIEGQPILDPKELAIDAITGAFVGPTARGRTALGLPKEQVSPVSEIPPTSETIAEPPAPTRTEATGRIDANLREAELSTDPSKRLKEAAFRDTSNDTIIPQGKGHDDFLKTDPRLERGYLTEDNTFVTPQEAKIIAENQHSDLLTKDVDPKEGFHSTDFGPERMDALKPKEESKSIAQELGIRNDSRSNFFEDVENYKLSLLDKEQKLDSAAASMSQEDLIAANSALAAEKAKFAEASKEVPQLIIKDKKKATWKETHEILAGAKTIGEGIDRLLKEGIGSKTIQLTLKILGQSKYIRDADLSISSNVKLRDGEPTLGQYVSGGVSKSHEVRLYGDSGLGTFIHEAFHAGAQRLLDTKTSEAAKELIKIFKKFEAIGEGEYQTKLKQYLVDNPNATPFELNKFSRENRRYGLTDVHEFVSEALSNHNFKQFLSEFKSDGSNGVTSNLWKDLKNSIYDGLGVPRKDRTALDDVLGHTETLLKESENFTRSELDGRSLPAKGSYLGDGIKTIKEKYDPRKEQLYKEIYQFSSLLEAKNWKLVGKNKDGETIYENRAADVPGKGGEYSAQIAEIGGEFYKYSEEHGMAVGKGYKSLDDLLTNSDYVDYRIKAQQDLKEYEEYTKSNKSTSSKDTALSSDSVGVKYDDTPGSDLEIWKQKVLRLHKETSASEKQSDPDNWTPQERSAWESGDWKEFSKLRGYSEKEIKVFQEYLDTVQEGKDKYGWSLDDIQSWELFGKQTGGNPKLTLASRGTDAPDAPTPAVDPKRYDPRNVVDEADLKIKGKELYAAEGADAARKFFTDYETYRDTWLNPVKEVEDFVEININNKMADERIVINNSNVLKALVPDAVAREQVSIAIDAKNTKSLTGAAKEAADKYTGWMKDIGERALKEGVVKGLLENYVTHIVNWKDLPKGALDTFLADVFGKKFKGEPSGMTPESRFGKERTVETFHQLDLALKYINERIEAAGKSDFRLEVKTKDIAEIYKQYALSMEKAIENKKLVDSIRQIRNVKGESLVRRITEEDPLPRGWTTIDDRQFAGFAVHPDLAPALKFAFEAKGGMILNALYIVSQTIKRFNVVASLFHAKSLMEVLNSTHTPIVTPIKEIALGITDKSLGTELSGIRKAVNEFKEGGLGSSVDKWQRGGLVLEPPGDVSKGVIASAGKFADSMISKFGPKTHILESALTATEKYTLGVFDKVTWDYLHTGGKLMTAEAYLTKAREQATKDGVPFDEAASRKEITSFINKSFGGLNWFQEARSAQTEFGKRMAMAAYSPEGRKALQIMLFAPDWTISTIKAFTSALPKGFNPTKWHPIEGVKGMGTPSTQADYARLYQFKTALTYLTLINGINLITANHPIWDNKDPTRIEWPDGTSMQAMKHAMEPYHWLADPSKTLSNKLGFVPKAAVIGLTGSEYASPSAPKLVDPSLTNRAIAIGKQALPFQASAAMSAPEGEGVKRALLGTIGLPVYGKTVEQRKVARKERFEAVREQREKFRERERMRENQ